MNQKALYYPYIHIQDVNWLKATLLLFSEVRRMLPAQFSPADSDEVRAFPSTMLSPADLWTPRALAAQEKLANRLLAEDGAFRSTYGSTATREAVLSTDSGFQIHQMKLHQPLQEALRSAGLAWRPTNFEFYDPYEEYVELHPSVGQAVMSTLAIASATGEGLDIVGDRRSGLLHSYLLEKKADEIYDACLHPSGQPADPRSATGEEVFEFLIGLPRALDDVTPDALASLGEDREPLRKLVAQLRVLASDIPAMDPGRERETYFRDIGSTALRNWEADRRNMSGYWKRFFDGGPRDASQKFVEKVAEKVTAGGVAGGGTVAATGAGIAATATAAVAGAGVGLAIGIVFHGVKTYSQMAKAEKDSPYRYLTLMEEAGVVFRGDLGSAPRRSTGRPTTFWGRVKDYVWG